MESEYQSLCDIVLARGVKHSEIISEIQRRVFDEYIERFPQSPRDVKIIIDETDGSVRIFSNKADITPEAFAPVAEKIALQVLIQKLKESENSTFRPVPAKPKTSAGFSSWLAGFLFFFYNSIYLLFIFLSSFSLLLNGSYREEIGEMFKELGALRGLTLLMLLVVPLISLYLVRNAKKINADIKLEKVIFIFEIPFIIILSLAVSLFEKATLPMWFFFFMGILMILSIFLESIKIKADSLRRKWLMLSMQQAALSAATYFLLLYTFFVPIVSAAFLNYLAEELYDFSLYTIIVFGFSAIYIGFLGILFIFPYIATFFLYKIFRRTQFDLLKEVGKKKLFKVQLAMILAWIFFLGAISFQFNTGLTNKLEAMNKTQSFEERESLARKLAPHEAKIEEELKNMSSARSHYFISRTDENLKRIYMDQLNFSESMGNFIQDSFTNLAYPFVYQGTFDEYGTAYGNFAYLFGRYPGETPRDLKPAGNVTLVSRTLSAKTDYQGMLATISVEEEYKGNSWSNQEVVYEFSLPSNSAVTDLKLGPNLEYDGVVAPRGAAAKVYQKEVTKSRDPALLEQTGPRQYRLRVFPIPRNGDSSLGGKNQRVKFSYVTELAPDGYALPVYSREINVIKDDNTKINYNLDGTNANGFSNSYFIGSYANLRNYNECSLPAPLYSGSAQSAFSEIIPYSTASGIANVYSCDRTTGVNVIKVMKGSKFAVLYDVSLENKKNSFLDDFTKVLSDEKTLLQYNEIDFYLFNDLLSKPGKVDLASSVDYGSLTYFGGSNWIDAVNKIDTKYDFIVVVTSDKYVSGKLDPKNKVPLYIIHKDNKVPAYSTEASNYVMEQGGIVASSFLEALNHWELSHLLGNTGSINYVGFGPYWVIGLSFLPPNIQEMPADFQKPIEGDPLIALANKGYIHGSIKGKDLEKDAMDYLNNVAQGARVVTPLSSLIALVNKTQADNLEMVSEDADRYTYDNPPANTDVNSRIYRFNNPTNSSSGWRSPSSEAPSSGRIQRWGATERPSGVPSDSMSALANVSGFAFIFIAVNVIIIAFGGFFSFVSAYRNRKKGK